MNFHDSKGHAITMQPGEHKVIDGFLPQRLFAEIAKNVQEFSFPWYRSNGVSAYGDDEDTYSLHIFFEPYMRVSQSATMVNDFINFVNPHAIVRCRALCYNRNDTLIEHGKHTDMEFPHTALVLYLNTNDGFTRLASGEKIMSVKNRALLINGNDIHNSSNCTDAKSRFVLTLNYL